MTDIKIAILRTFESTVQALLINNPISPIFDSDSNIGFGQICDHLQIIRHELSEVKNRLQHIEQCHTQNVTVQNGESNWFDNKCRSVDKSDLSDTDELEHDLNMVLSAPIPLRSVNEERPATPPVPPEIVPNLVKADEPIPDIEDDYPHVNTPTATTAKEDIADDDADAEEVDADADADADEADADADADEADADSDLKEDTKPIPEDKDDSKAIPDAQEDDAEEDEAEEDEDAEEEGLEEFIFKQKTYYKDGDNLVYILNDEGELNEDPIGRWNEAMSVVRFFAKTVA